MEQNLIMPPGVSVARLGCKTFSKTTMHRYIETFETWNKIASLYQEKFMELDLYNETYDFFCNAITRINADILEIGCGPGNITKYLLSKRPDFTIYGIDIAPNMIDLAKKNNPMANFNVMDCREISRLTKKFDGIIGGFCLPYLSEDETATLILDSSFLLTENGFIYLSFVEGDPIKSGFQVGSSGDRTYFYYHDLESIKAQLAETGFEEIKIFKVAFKKSTTEDEMHTILIAKKKCLTKVSEYFRPK